MQQQQRQCDKYLREFVCLLPVITIEVDPVWNVICPSIQLQEPTSWFQLAHKEQGTNDGASPCAASRKRDGYFFERNF